MINRRQFLQLSISALFAFFIPQRKAQAGPTPAPAVEVGCLPACLPFWVACGNSQPPNNQPKNNLLYFPLVSR